MRNFWITGAARFYSNELGRELYSIQMLEDEDTNEKYRSSYLYEKFKIPAGYQVPCGYYDQRDEYGNIIDYIRFDQLMIFDQFGNSRGAISIENLFNLWCELEGARQNDWL